LDRFGRARFSKTVSDELLDEIMQGKQVRYITPIVTPLKELLFPPEEPSSATSLELNGPDLHPGGPSADPPLPPAGVIEAMFSPAPIPTLGERETYAPEESPVETRSANAERVTGAVEDGDNG
jgi:hypothetical protein